MTRSLWIARVALVPGCGRYERAADGITQIENIGQAETVPGDRPGREDPVIRRPNEVAHELTRCD